MNWPSISNVFENNGFWYLEFEGKDSRVDLVDPEYYTKLMQSRSFADCLFWAERARRKGQTYETTYEAAYAPARPV